MLDTRFNAWRHDPFGILGRHGDEVRVFMPGALGVDLLDRETGQQLTPLHELSSGFFAGTLQDGDYRLRVSWPREAEECEDPYRFGTVLGELDLYLFNEGRHWELARHMGAIPMPWDGVDGVAFSVWAPNARAVSVVGDFNGWNAQRHPMRLRHNAGVWELFLPGVRPGARYKFDVQGYDGISRQKADPLARASEPPPATASVVAPAPDFDWSDADWMSARADRHHAGAPISIYEIHASSWRRPEQGGTYDWDQLGDLPIPYVTGLGFTHVELMPIMEHPFGGSWGYQPLSQFAPSARYGTPAQFARFVDRCHLAGLGVILDWVPGHFPNDAHGLELFDGTHLYEHADPKEGYHPDWNTLIYNLGRAEIRGYLIASALWWLETFHIDGLRVDAVASLLYRDYSRKAGEWVPNRFGGRENLESLEFLRTMNLAVHERVPGAITIAEESTAWPGVTEPVDRGGLGFSFKWNMGWMNDTLRFMKRDPVHRAWHTQDVGFGLAYAFSERFILPLSHDEVVHGKGSLIGKMPGDDWRKRANLRALLTLMWTHPGKKLLFMGGELGQWNEWDHDGELAWDLLDEPAHSGISDLIAQLNTIYRREGALHHSDADARGFRWLVEGGDQAIFAFCRSSAYGGVPLVAAINMTPTPREDVRLGVPLGGRWELILNSDSSRFGGSDYPIIPGAVTEAAPSHGLEQSLNIALPPLGGLLYRYEGV